LLANFSFAQKCGTYEGSFENEKNKFPEMKKINFQNFTNL